MDLAKFFTDIYAYAVAHWAEFVQAVTVLYGALNVLYVLGQGLWEVIQKYLDLGADVKETIRGK